MGDYTFAFDIAMDDPMSVHVGKDIRYALNLARGDFLY